MTAFAMEPIQLAWNSSPIALQQHEGVYLPQTPHGDVILSFTNRCEAGQHAQVAISVGNAVPRYLSIEPFMNAPFMLVQSCNGESLSISNASSCAAPLEVQAWAPDLVVPQILPADEQFYEVAPASSREIAANADFIHLILRSMSTYTVFGLFIDNKASLYCINAPDLDTVPLHCYSEVTLHNSWPLSGSWNGQQIRIANLSPQATQASISLQSL
jgi:hypothetical protein